MRRGHYTLLMVLLALVGTGWIWAGRVTSGSGADGASLPPAPVVGHPAPDFTLTMVNGETFALSDHRGTPVVLNFWATWCPPCRAELPELEAASRRYQGQVVIVGVDQAEPASTVQAFAQQMGLTFPLPLDTSAQVSRLYRVRSLPTTYFIDREGIIREMQIGALTEATLAQLLRSVYP
jgi:cytochrome c biogenesis protein CcmG, thiol:disulfide interchange protein DsbE